MKAKKFILTEKQFKNLLSHEIGKAVYSPLKKPFTINIFENRLDEGMYKTFDTNFVVRHFCGYLKFTNDWGGFANNPDIYNGFITKVAGENGEDYIEFVSVDDAGLLKRVDDAMKLCGFYRAFCETYCDGYVQAGYEKRHDKPITLKTNKLYHIARRESLPKIKREGLVPKSRDKQTHHLDRIYFFTRDYGKSAFKKIAEDLYDGKTSFGYAVIEVDVNELGDNVVFHNDLNTNDGVYTTDNISPEALNVKYQIKYE